MFDNAFRRTLGGRVARELDAEFEGFMMPRMAGRLGMKPTPSNVVLGTDDAIIRLSELGKYEAVLAMAKKKSGPLRRLDAHMDQVNRETRARFEASRTLYRGMKISELCTMAEAGGTVGLHRRTRYAARIDFVSCSIDFGAALLFAAGKEERGLVVEMDVSGMKETDYAPVTYEARRDIRVTRRGRHAYSPYEMFGGNHSGVYTREWEIHLRPGTRPVIRRIMVRGKRPAGFVRRLGAAVAALEAAQGRKIMIKYARGQQ
ncbi:MAG: hypothetical protein OXM01_05850 [Gemmatimonadota bacterium]|nr:hypothetical protein [Gemmatimonadota bacterium]